MNNVCRVVKAILDLQEDMADRIRKAGGHPFELSDVLSEKEMEIVEDIKKRGIKEEKLK